MPLHLRLAWMHPRRGEEELHAVQGDLQGFQAVQGLENDQRWKGQDRFGLRILLVKTDVGYAFVVLFEEVFRVP